ncbi:tRNA lysidine(34) synthetase TilS [Vibrio sp. Of14-4]|uniref:tRNA lysidine(34) synthetase TilS n=1 Tax=Vibrio sp. Of14-4 TaxID=2724878 RepID=UPI001EF2A378|nr:tRNA lysidine(34) synthetase TilS [Vibrio sp. Of14-4]MCG7488626.1 tRNA lysidine(34) synthetase TilS [Vibrio sp. Of14-4]
MDLYQHFSSVIDQYMSSEGRLVVALSGGVDSRVLLALAARYQKERKKPCIAIHVHHGLSSNADHWAKQCRLWCLEEGVLFHLEKVRLEKQGKSIEESAREARYQALKSHLVCGDLLLTGQHRDDQLETFLLALKRGSGPKGLSSMAQCTPYAGAKLVRPILQASREEVESYAQIHNLTWVEDESNQDTRFDRNFLRHQVIPCLTERWPHLTKSVQRSAELCAEQESLLDELLSDHLEKSVHQDDSIDIAQLAEMSSLVRARVLRMWINKQQAKMPSRDLLDRIWFEVAMSRQDANPILSLAEGQIRRFNHRLYLVAQWQDLSFWQHEIKFDCELTLPESLGSITLLNTQSGTLSKAALSNSPLRIIFEPQGLSAKPCGRRHSRKLKKLFQEYHVPSWLRRRLPILMCGDKVVAVAGIFIDADFVGQDCELVWDKFVPDM